MNFGLARNPRRERLLFRDSARSSPPNTSNKSWDRRSSREERSVRNADGVRDSQHRQGPGLDQPVHRGARHPEPVGNLTDGQQLAHCVMHHQCTKRRRNRWKRCHRMRSCATFDPNVVEGIRSQVTRYHAVRIGIRPFGTKGSQVQILSPRPSNALKSQQKTGFQGVFIFRTSWAPHH
jgi:hypothetical protein